MGFEASEKSRKMFAAKLRMLAAAAEGEGAAVRDWLSQGVSPHSRSNGIAALHWACGARERETRSKFASASGRIRPKDTPSRIDAVRALLEAGADPRAPDGAGMHAAHWAAKAGLPGVLAELARGGADVGAHGRAGATPLMEACAGKDGYVQGGALDVLIGLGADLEARDGAGRTAILVAAGDPGAVAALAKAGASSSAKDKAGRTALHAACAANRLASAEALLAAGADPAALDAKGIAPWGLGGGKAASRVRIEAEARAIEAAAGPGAASREPTRI